MSGFSDHMQILTPDILLLAKVWYSNKQSLKRLLEEEMAEQINDRESDLLTAGKVVDNINVEIGVRFLEHFSEQLYSSPHKAFEELISNSWDAGAKSVFVEFPDDLDIPDAAIWVLDDGASMDAAGLHDLWKVAYSPKENERTAYGRPVIGKFGIGKLATYVLANNLTFLCKASDGVIRIVTMDYTAINTDGSQLIEQLSLPLRQITMDEVEKVLETTTTGKSMLELIKSGVPAPERPDWEDEYRSDSLDPPPDSGCWTLVVLSDLKSQGRAIKRGIIRRMMETSLPLGRNLSIVLDGEPLGSSKLDKEVLKEWIVGPELGFNRLNLPPELGVDAEEQNEEVTIVYGSDPEPFVEIPDVGRVTGTIRVYVDNISGGKSENLGPSNGFFVNVLGRVINHDPAFGEKDLSHSVWARFRMTVRADGLDDSLAVNREQFFQNRSIRIFRAFLRRAFNMARVHYDDVVSSAWAEPGENLVNSWGTLPLRPLREVVTRSLSGDGEMLSLFDDVGLGDRDAALTDWTNETTDDVTSVLKRVDFEDSAPDLGVSRYRVADRTLAINKLHPFVQEHFSSNEEKRAVRNFALVEFLSDVHALDLGIDQYQIEQLREYRDQMARLVAQVDRKSGANIARILIHASTYKDPNAFEIIVSDALDYLGYAVERLAKPGQPEGVARAYPTPAPVEGEQLYSFTYDAKSSKSGKVKTGNVGVAGLRRHREAYHADYALVVAPSFEEGALVEECAQNGVTPINAPDLGKLLQYTATYGAISLNKLREIFDYNSPANVALWVDNLEEWIKERVRLTFDIFIEGLKMIEEDIPDVVSSAQIAEKCRTVSDRRDINADDVVYLARGLNVIVPDLIRVERKDIIISARPNKIADSVSSQINAIYSTEPLEIES